MSEKQGQPGAAPQYAPAAPMGVPTAVPGYSVQIPGAPPTYAESLTHQVVPGSALQAHYNAHVSPGLVPVQYSSAYVVPGSAQAQYNAYVSQAYAQAAAVSQAYAQAANASQMYYSAAKVGGGMIPATAVQGAAGGIPASQAEQAKLLYSQQYSQQQKQALAQQQYQLLQAQPGAAAALYQQQIAAAAGAGMYYPAQPVYQPGQNVLVMNGYDAGARFDGNTRPTIPPPPPGVAPNHAQMAAANGANVAMTQKKTSFLSGGSNGGYTFW